MSHQKLVWIKHMSVRRYATEVSAVYLGRFGCSIWLFVCSGVTGCNQIQWIWWVLCKVFVNSNTNFWWQNESFWLRKKKKRKKIHLILCYYSHSVTRKPRYISELDKFHLNNSEEKGKNKQFRAHAWSIFLRWQCRNCYRTSFFFYFTIIIDDCFLFRLRFPYQIPFVITGIFSLSPKDIFNYDK